MQQQPGTHTIQGKLKNSKRSKEEVQVRVSIDRVMKKGIPVILSTILIFVLLSDLVLCGRVHYQYKKYTYRKKRDDKTYKSLKQPCEVNPDCLAKRGAGQAICIRQCVSEFCYQDIYGPDELEEGEIDVRLNSFKGCAAQQRGK